MIKNEILKDRYIRRYFDNYECVEFITKYGYYIQPRKDKVHFSSHAEGKLYELQVKIKDLKVGETQSLETKSGIKLFKVTRLK